MGDGQPHSLTPFHSATNHVNSFTYAFCTSQNDISPVLPGHTSLFIIQLLVTSYPLIIETSICMDLESCPSLPRQHLACRQRVLFDASHPILNLSPDTEPRHTKQQLARLIADERTDTRV
ncbi:hypothetical protein M3J09_010186 [Ascochyta lentis]